MLNHLRYAFLRSRYLPISHKQASKAFAELSCRPSIINNTTEMVSVEPKGLSDFKKGETVACYVKAVRHLLLRINVFLKILFCISHQNLIDVIFLLYFPAICLQRFSESLQAALHNIVITASCFLDFYPFSS